jgi:hypothetical protein
MSGAPESKCTGWHQFDPLVYSKGIVLESRFKTVKTTSESCKIHIGFNGLIRPNCHGRRHSNLSVLIAHLQGSCTQM